jgi:hypothetical protein
MQMQPAHVGNNGQSAGSMRFNTNTQQIEAYDGYNWIPVIANTDISLSPDAEQVLKWGRERINEEQSWEALAATNQAVRIALDHFTKAREQLTVTAKLAREYEQTTS